MVHTHPYYWDCECAKDYIHAKDTCDHCIKYIKVGGFLVVHAKKTSLN